MVYNDMLMAAGGGQLVKYVPCVCSAQPISEAFDTVDHDLLMRRLERQYGLRDVVLQWFCSYLSGIASRRKNDGHLSPCAIF